MHCGVCGATLTKDAKFCNSCGNKVEYINPNPNFAQPPTKHNFPRKLYRSRKDRWIAGVCGGLGEYFDIDPILIRFLWLLFILLGGSGILAYIIGIVVIPESPYDPWVE